MKDTRPAARFEVVSTEAGHHVRLVAANGEIVMSSEVYADKRDAQRAIEIAGEAVGRVLEPKRPGPRR